MASLAPAGQSLRRWDAVATKIVPHAVVIVLCALTVFPLLWMLSTSVKVPTEVFEPGINLLPRRPTLENFRLAWELFPVGWWFFNSTVIAIGITLGKLIVSFPAAYAFTRLDFPGRNLLFSLVLGTMIVPYVVTVVPAYVLVAQWGWVNTSQGVIVPSIAHTAFYVFLLRQYIITLPQEIFDAARIDGAGVWATMWQVVFPNIRPAIAVVTVLAFLGAWNQYLWPLLILNEVEKKTLAVAMQFFASNPETGQFWGALMATAAVATLPPLTIYALAQQKIISAFVTSGIKG
jgi:ABC-type glycerol-3-phosphate transport system permease component